MRLRRGIGRGSRSGAKHVIRLPLATAVVGSIVVLCTAGWSAAEVRIVGPEEVRARYCREEGGVLVLVLPGFAPMELVTSTDDPAVANKGDGSFHPLDRGTVEDAIKGLAFPVDRVDAAVYVLPYPRRAGLESAASHGAILLAPGTLPVPATTVHAVVAHEFGHVVQRAFAPVGSPAWSAYLALRGLSLEISTSAAEGTSGPGFEGTHSEHPREIFAEDFRSLLGSELARGDGSLENATIGSPLAIDGLAQFLTDLPERARRTALAGAMATGRAVAAYPNPFRHAVTLSAAPALSIGAFPTERTIRIVDARGRVVRRAAVTPAVDGAATWRWDGTDDDGRTVVSGSYFAQVEGETGRATRVVFVR